MMKTYLVIFFAGLLQLTYINSAYGEQPPPACLQYRCSCISTSGSGQMGYGGPQGNIAIRLVAVNPAVTSITVTNCNTGQIFFSGRPFVGQQINVNAKMCAKAYANRVGLMCAVHYWIIDYKGNPHR